jgi:hypothetical protein
MKRTRPEGLALGLEKLFFRMELEGLELLMVHGKNLVSIYGQLTGKGKIP